MSLSDMDKQRLLQAARAAGIDEDEVLREGESLSGGSGDDEPLSDEEGHPIAERMLIGFLPYVTVKEFRTIWLKLDTPIADWEMITGDWLNIHGETAKTSSGDE